MVAEGVPREYLTYLRYTYNDAPYVFQLLGYTSSSSNYREPINHDQFFKWFLAIAKKYVTGVSVMCKSNHLPVAQGFVKIFIDTAKFWGRYSRKGAYRTVKVIHPDMCNEPFVIDLVSTRLHNELSL